VVEGYISLAEARAGQADLLEQAIPRIADQVRRAPKAGALSGPGPIFLGIGASFAAAAGAVWTLRSRGIDSWRLNAGEYPIPFPVSEHPIVGVSQSGRSAETLAVLSATTGRLRMAVVNVSPSPVADIASTPIALGNLPDSYASTTGYTATIAALGMMAEAWDGGETDPSWSTFVEHFRRVEAEMAGRVRQLASVLADVVAADYAAAAPSVGSAEVGSLLLREIARVPATGFSTRQYLHGAMESAGQTAHVLVGGERELGVAQTLAHAGHKVILVTTLDVVEQPHLSVVRIPDVSAVQRTILEALVMQSLAVETALIKGIDPDAFVFFHNDTKVA
jgi:glucosamine--fructose-6-phosphate aminotransferase (isomerizing)